MKDIYVTKPSLPSLEGYTTALEEIWKTGKLTNYGPFEARFRNDLAAYLGLKDICLSHNGTTALLVALKSLKLSGEVITTPFSFPATLSALIWNDLTPVFADLIPGGFNIDPDAVEAQITEKTSAILAVHCYGIPCNTVRLAEIAEKHGLKLVYDAAHCFGVTVNGRSILEYGDISAISFHATKVFSTVEGGAIASTNAELLLDANRLQNFGLIDETTVVSPGLNGKMNELCAAFGLQQLQNYAQNRSLRKRLYDLYSAELAHIDGLELPAYDDATNPNFGYFPVLVKPNFPVTRDALYSLLKAKGIHCRKYFAPLMTEFSYFKRDYAGTIPALPNAKIVADCVLCLPIYPELAEGDLYRVTGAIIEIMERGDIP